MRLSDFTFTFHFHELEKEMATHSSVLAWNPRDSGAWWAAVYGVAQSRTRLKWLSNSVALQECHISKIMQYSVFLVRLLLVEIILLRFVLLHVSKVHTFWLLNHTPLCGCTTIFLFTSQQTSKLCMILDHLQIKLQQKFRYRPLYSHIF